MNNTEIITTHGLREVGITTTEEARRQRDELLLATQQITTIATREQAELAVNTMADVKALLKLIEAARVAAKAPMLDIGKQIDGLAKELTLRLDVEASRLSRVLGVYTAEQNRLAAKAREEQEARERAAREAREAEERAIAEKARAAQAELDRKANAARSEARAEEYRREKEAAELKAKQDKERRDLAAEQELQRSRQAAAAVAIPKVAGVATRNEVRFEVTDAVALYEAAPYLVILTPNVTAIKGALKTLTGEQKLPGVRHWFEHVAVGRG